MNTVTRTGSAPGEHPHTRRDHIVMPLEIHPARCTPAWYSQELTEPYLPVLHDWEFKPRGPFGQSIAGNS